jgi:acetolactate synthase-1/2/3 large subunit
LSLPRFCALETHLARNKKDARFSLHIGMEANNRLLATIAKGMGCYGEGSITDGDKVGPALKRAIEYIKKEGKPAVVDTMTQFR